MAKTLSFAFYKNGVYLNTHEGCVFIDDMTHAPAVSADAAGSGLIKASMDGGIIDVLVEGGQTVKKGQTLVVLEAMKMEHSMKADSDGVIKSILVSKGDQVKGRQLLVEIESESVAPEVESA